MEEGRDIHLSSVSVCKGSMNTLKIISASLSIWHNLRSVLTFTVHALSEWGIKLWWRTLQLVWTVLMYEIWVKLRHSDAFFWHRSLNLTQGEREREETRLSSWIYVYCLTCSLLWAFSGSSEVSNSCLSYTIWVSDAGLSAARCSALSPVCICMN